MLRATARFTSPRAMFAGAVEIRARRFVIATGSQPAAPPIAGLDEVPYLTNETVFANRELPEHLIVIGGGPIGIEMAQAHRRLGARVTVLDRGPLLPRDDPELAALLAERLAGEGIALRPRVAIAAVARDAAGVDGPARRWRRDQGFASAGRRRPAAEHRSAWISPPPGSPPARRGSPSMRGCAPPTGASLPSAMSRAGRNSPMSRSITPGS